MTLLMIANITKQAYYKYKKRCKEQLFIEDYILGLVLKIKSKEHENRGIDKLYRVIEPILIDNKIKFGRDKFRSLMRKNKLVIKRPKRRQSIREQKLNSSNNLIKAMVVNKTDEVWATDTTYLKYNGNQRAILGIVMDYYSRKIIGYKLEKNMSAGPKAIEVAFQSGKPHIIHSDRGFEYTNNMLRDALAKQDVKTSYSKPGTPTENARMERCIGTIKNELQLKKQYKNSFEQLELSIKSRIDFYNNIRTHQSLKFKTPASVYADSKTVNLF